MQKFIIKYMDVKIDAVGLLVTQKSDNVYTKKTKKDPGFTQELVAITMGSKAERIRGVFTKLLA